MSYRADGIREFTAGTIITGFRGNLPPVIKPICKEITIRYPSRLEAISIDESKIAEETPDHIYTAGQIDFCVNICNTITVRLRKDSEITISKGFERGILARHAAILMQKILGSERGFDICVKQELKLPHCGLGSSSAIIQGVGAAINELYGNPVSPLDLIHYLCSNHGEEADQKDLLVHVQSVGGSGICGHFMGGLIINAGRAVPIFQKNLPDDLFVVVGIPRTYTVRTGEEMIKAEINNMAGFLSSGEKYVREISYRLVNKVMPALFCNDFKPCKDLIFDVRYNMESNKNCAFYYPEILHIAEMLKGLKDDPEIDFISLSSVGPAFFIISRNYRKAERMFQSLDMMTHIASIHNSKYVITVRR